MAKQNPSNDGAGGGGVEDGYLHRAGCQHCNPEHTNGDEGLSSELRFLMQLMRCDCPPRTQNCLALIVIEPSQSYEYELFPKFLSHPIRPLDAPNSTNPETLNSHHLSSADSECNVGLDSRDDEPAGVCSPGANLSEAVSTPQWPSGDPGNDAVCDLSECPNVQQVSCLSEEGEIAARTVGGTSDIVVSHRGHRNEGSLSHFQEPATSQRSSGEHRHGDVAGLESQSDDLDSTAVSDLSAGDSCDSEQFSVCADRNEYPPPLIAAESVAELVVVASSIADDFPSHMGSEYEIASVEVMSQGEEVLDRHSECLVARDITLQATVLPWTNHSRDSPATVERSISQDEDGYLLEEGDPVCGTFEYVAEGAIPPTRLEGSISSQAICDTLCDSADGDLWRTADRYVTIGSDTRRIPHDQDGYIMDDQKPCRESAGSGRKLSACKCLGVAFAAGAALAVAGVIFKACKSQ